MLRRLTQGFALTIMAATAVAACSSSGTNTPISVGPNFPTQTLYATNATQNAVSIYPPGTTGGPAYQIGGSTTTLDGPQYLAFDNLSNLFVTNYDVTTGAASIVELKALATGNVQPYNSINLGTVHPRGIAFYEQPLPQSTASPIPSFVVAAVDPSGGAGFTSKLLFYTGSLGLFEAIGGPNTALNVPSGVALDAAHNVYVTNLQTKSVEVFALPSQSPTPTPAPSTSPTASPSPTPTPAGATPSPTPSPVPTASPINVAPINVITGTPTDLGQPTGVAVSSSGTIYVSDTAASLGTTQCVTSATCGAVLIFPAGSTGAATPTAIAGPNTKLNAPTDVKLDKTGQIYVGDTTPAGAGVIYVFPSGASGNIAPKVVYTSPGAVIGIGLTP